MADGGFTRFRVCSKCRRNLPSSEEFFHPSTIEKKGSGGWCKQCFRDAGRIRHAERYVHRERVSRTCECCGKTFLNKPHVKFCSRKCCGKKKAQNRKELRTCLQCGKAWLAEPKAGNRCQRCAALRAAQIKSEIATIRRKLTLGGVRGYDNAKVKADKRRSERPVKREHTPAIRYSHCVVCRTSLHDAFPGTKYCGQSCAIRAAGERRSEKCGFVRTVKSCAVCGVQWSPLYGDRNTNTCSMECRAYYIRQVKQAGKRKRRVTKRNSAYGVNPVAHYVNAMTVFNRDGWKCRACGCDTPRRLRGSCDDNAPELDHIIPVCKGGSHTLDNLQCLCRTCNALKSSMDMNMFALWMTSNEVKHVWNQ